MHKKKTASLLLLIFISAVLTSGCTQTTSGTAIHVQAEIIQDNNPLLSVQMEVTTTEPKADDVIIAACKQEKLPYTYNSGMFDNFGGIASTETDGWLLYHNGQLANVGAKDIAISEGDIITFKYENYNAAFVK